MITIKPVVSDDQIITVEKMARMIWVGHYTPIIGEQQVAYMLAEFQSFSAIKKQIKEGAQYFIADNSDSGDLGYFAVRVESGKEELFLSKFYIKEEMRGRGFARELLAFIESLARSFGLRAIVLRTHKKNVQTLAVYKKLGFTIVEPVMTDIGCGYVLDDFVLRKDV